MGYRRYVLEVAQELGVAGFVKNEEDGSVSIFAQGEDEALEMFLDRVKNPPPPAVIREVKIAPSAPKRGLKVFKIRYGRLADELQESLGTMQMIFVSYWDEFRDFRGEFKDFRNEFRDFRDLSIKLSQETLEEVRELRRDLRALLDERLARLERDVAEIKARLGLSP